MIAWVTAKLQDEAKQGVHSADLGVAPAAHAHKCQQRRTGGLDSRPQGDNPLGRDHSNSAAVNEVSKEDW